MDNKKFNCNGCKTMYGSQFSFGSYIHQHCFNSISLLPLNIKQNQTINIYDRQFPHKTFLSLVEKEYYTFHVQNEVFVLFIILVDSFCGNKPETLSGLFSNIISYSLGSKSYKWPSLDIVKLSANLPKLKSYKSPGYDIVKLSARIKIIIVQIKSFFRGINKVRRQLCSIFVIQVYFSFLYTMTYS